MFKVTIPCYNCEKWIIPCLSSLLSQTYTDWVAVVVNDGSTDNTASLIESFIKQHNTERIKVIHNSKNEGSALGSIIQCTNNFTNCKGEDIIVNIDGDDMLADNKVFEYLNEVYSNDRVLMTYGQFEPLSHSYHNYCQPLANTSSYRKSNSWVVSHLRTYKKKLFDLINDSDLRDDDGEYYKMAGDAALLYPLIEMAGLHRIKFISKVLYIYNDTSELNEMKRDAARQIRIANKIKAKREYKESNI
jgi:glycosyltransferase involved in cell wall biosynthesis